MLEKLEKKAVQERFQKKTIMQKIHKDQYLGPYAFQFLLHFWKFLKKSLLTSKYLTRPKRKNTFREQGLGPFLTEKKVGSNLLFRGICFYRWWLCTNFVVQNKVRRPTEFGRIQPKSEGGQTYPLTHKVLSHSTLTQILDFKVM